MTLSTEQMLARLDSAFKNIVEVSDLGDAVLQPEKATAFVREMALATKLLPAARFVSMAAKQRDIDRVAIHGRVIRSGKGSTGNHVDLTAADAAEPSFATNRLITNELVAIISLRDDTLRENIEQNRLEQTLLGLFGEAAGRDFEEYAIYGDTEVAYADDPVLSLSDGWVRLAANKLYGQNEAGQVARDFDPASDGSGSELPWPENLFQAQIDALPKRYFNNPADWVIYVDFETEDAYRDLLRSRGTQLGDSNQTQRPPVFYKGIRIEYVPMFERTPDHGNDPEDDVVEGRVSILVNPSNLVWGVFHQVMIEREREAKARRTDFVLTFEPDMHYEDENAVVVCLIDKANPEAL